MPASRDLFDAHELLTCGRLDPDRLRLGLGLYGAMDRRDWWTLSLDDLGYDARDLGNQLLPPLMVRRRCGSSPAVLPVPACPQELLGAISPRGDGWAMSRRPARRAPRGGAASSSAPRGLRHGRSVQHGIGQDGASSTTGSDS